MQVSLTDHEVALARVVGRARRQSAIDNNRPAFYGRADNGSEVEADEQAAGGELAAAIAYNLPWTGVYYRDLGSAKPADIGQATEVRRRSKEWYDLIVHPEDRDDWRFVLVLGALPNFTVVGSIGGVRAKREEWWSDPAGGRPAFFVPQTALTRVRS